MKIHQFRQIHGLLILTGLLVLTSGLSFGLDGTNSTSDDQEDYFLYIDFCGRRYNQSTQGYDYVIKAVKLPVSLLKKVPRLENYGMTTKKNQLTYNIQQEMIRPYRGNNVTLRVNRDRLIDFYPEGLKKGFVIEKEEFNRWDFIEKAPAQIDPVQLYYYRGYPWYYVAPILRERITDVCPIPSGNIC
jgi:hypothetical protein